MDENLLQAWMSRFVDWLRPDPKTAEDIRRQAHEIRERIKKTAGADGLIVQSTPSTGSFAKNTGLRRHITGGSAVEGMDVDVPFVLLPRGRNGEDLSMLTTLLPRFQSYASQEFGPEKVSVGQHAVRITFKKARRAFDLVPMIATESKERQLIFRNDGVRVETSVETHVKFVTSRTAKSSGRCKFHECVRLLKWSCRYAPDENLKASSFVLELLCAHAFDTLQDSQDSYATTLAAWLAKLASVVTDRKPVLSGHSLSYADRVLHGWEVLDPCNPRNNVVAGWNLDRINVLAKHLRRMNEAAQMLVTSTRLGQENEARRWCKELFGPAFKTQAIDATTNR